MPKVINQPINVKKNTTQETHDSKPTIACSFVLPVVSDPPNDDITRIIKTILTTNAVIHVYIRPFDTDII